ncbi:vitelline membrane outer layer protein 1 homolog [Pangasianodon hypophthalmus]|uniref:vitelline membrane outer layer protein 1 homolog n=1 Tax=Pangasianodon hypophthalmus TaxID=310915 RepID=UPI00230702F5|nr:vitelline membrane outer layer protein 1 homolog [Pangasianodon hypophthalmus]
MYFVLSAVLPLLILSFGECASVNDTQNRIVFLYPSTISVTNGQMWGSWGPWAMCPSGTYATGFTLKVESNQGYWGDDTALNGIALQCSKPIGTSGIVGGYTTVSSSVGSWGSWKQNIWCSRGVLRAFQLRVESYQGIFVDDTAANNIRFQCTGGQVLEGSGMGWGTWGYWSSVCGGTGICGIQTKVEPPQGAWDDTSLNDVRFSCC